MANRVLLGTIQRRISLAAALLGALVATGCGGGSNETSASTGSGQGGSGGANGSGGSGASGGAGGSEPTGGGGSGGAPGNEYKVKTLLGTCAIDWQIGGTDKNEGLGTTLTAVDDVDGDGVRDFVVIGGTSIELRSGATGALVKQVNVPNADQVAPLGADLDGDGVPDIAVYATSCIDPGSGGGTSTSGPCTHAFRALSGHDLAPLFALDGASGDSNYAWSVVVVADEDGDGKPDLAVGSGAGMGEQSGGRVDIISSKTKAVLRTITFDSATQVFGQKVLGNVDLDGDGRPDLLIGDGFAQAGRGQVTAVAATGAVLWTVVGEPGDPDLLGDNLTWAGDLDGDGVSDVLLGVHNHHNGTGRVIAVSGKTGTVLWKTEGLREEMGLGLAATPVGDLDGDGVPDLLVGGPKQDFPLLSYDGHGGFFEILSGKTGKPLVQEEEILPPQDPKDMKTWVLSYRLGGAVAKLTTPTSDGVKIAVSAAQAPFADKTTAGRVLGFTCKP